MYRVYWTNNNVGGACSEDFGNLTEALAHAKHLRDIGRTFVTMCSEDPNSVGRPGVDSVIDGILPNGDIYEWKMRR